MWWTNAHRTVTTQYRYCYANPSCGVHEHVGQTVGQEGHSISRSDNHIGNNKHIYSEYCTKCNFQNSGTYTCPGNPCISPW